jgi:hypothetical protein
MNDKRLRQDAIDGLDFEPSVKVDQKYPSRRTVDATQHDVGRQAGSSTPAHDGRIHTVFQFQHLKENCMRTVKFALVLSAALLSACATVSTGTGYGTNRSSGSKEIQFEWRSRNNLEGTLTAIQPDGRRFTGPYFQITSETRIDRLHPIWAGWDNPWLGWRHWSVEPSQEFIRHYSGRVLANLEASDGARMRCRLRLLTPSAGMRGGAEGRCQVPDGRRIDASFPRT